MKLQNSFGQTLIQQLEWLNKSLIPYRNSKSILYWDLHREKYLKLQKIENWIIKCAHKFMDL